MSDFSEFKNMANLFHQMAERTQDISPALEEISDDLQSKAEEAFQARRSPTGQTWNPIKESTRSINKASSGRLRRSFRTDISKDWIALVSDVPYAAVQNFGNPNNKLFGTNKTAPIPARPFSPISNEGEIPEDLRRKLNSAIWKRIFGNNRQ